MVTVQDIFNILPQNTKYKLVNGIEEVWSGSELKRCKYRNAEVEYMRILGDNEKRYIELTINSKHNILFCRECGNYFIEDKNGNIEELDRLPTEKEESQAIEITCAEHC